MLFYRPFAISLPCQFLLKSSNYLDDYQYMHKIYTHRILKECNLSALLQYVLHHAELFLEFSMRKKCLTVFRYLDLEG